MTNQGKPMTSAEIKAAFAKADEVLKDVPYETVKIVYDTRSDRARKAETIAVRTIRHLESLGVLPGGNQSLMAVLTIARCIEESDL